MASGKEIALIVGAGSGLSAALARLFAKEGMAVMLAARNTAKLEGLIREIGARAITCDASKPADVQALFDGPVRAAGTPAIVVYNASGRVKGYANSSSFAMGKFGLRGLAQSMARELAPKNIHVAHFVIDGGILQGPSDTRGASRGPDGMLLPEAIAETYLHVHRQHRSAWTWEVELRPWVESF
jgi:NAD(P)-dependent dehydrogenase (short-subunit alcohol dehydrogenase family)